MTPQIFILNVPAELTTWGSNSIEVICKATRDEEGSLLMVNFIDVDTRTMIGVKNWYAIWDIAMSMADGLWDGKTKSKHIAEILEDEGYIPHDGGWSTTIK